ncbi:MAG: DUF3999 domain-containing protein [Methylotenera sp.]|nr:DUF3999 domain-containing protein [Methylotenera sp.]
MRLSPLFLAATFCLANSAIAADFKLNATGSEPLYQSTLPKAVYQQSRADDLQDLTISNAAGEQVPYAMLPYHALHPQIATTLDSKPLIVFPIKENSLSNPNELSIQLEKNAQNTSLSLNMNASTKEVKTTYLVDAGKKHPALQTLNVDWQSGEGVLLSLEVLASEDLKNWSSTGHGVLLKTSANGQVLLQNNITLDTPTEARYLQIRPANGETLILKAVNAQYNSVRSLTPSILWQEVLQTQREQDEKNSTINIDFEAQGRYPASYLRVQLPQNNTITSANILVRNKSDAPWAYLSSAALYRMDKAGKTYTNPDISVNTSSWRFWRLQFSQSNGGIGATNPSLSLGWLPQTVVWNARGQAPFSLAVGTNPKTINTVGITSLIFEYEIEKVLQLPKANVVLNSASNTTAAPTTNNSWTTAPDYKTWLLWAGLALGVLLLASMAYSLIRTENNTK